MKNRNIEGVLSRINDDRETIRSTYWKHIPTATQHKILIRLKENISLAVYWFEKEVLTPIYDVFNCIWNVFVNLLRLLRDGLVSMNLGESV